MRLRASIGLGVFVLAALLVVGGWRLRRDNEHLRAEREVAVRGLAAVSGKVDAERQALAALREKRSGTELTEHQRLERELAERYRELAAAREPRLPRNPNLNGLSSGFIFQELLGDAEYRSAVKEFKRFDMEIKYAPWLRKIVSGDLRGQVSEILLEREMVSLERGRMEMPPTVLKRQKEEEIAALIEDIAMEELWRFEYSLRIRSALAAVAARLSYAAEPLSESQREAIIGRLYANPANHAPAGEFTTFPWEEAKDLFTRGQWEDVVRQARETGLLPE